MNITTLSIPDYLETCKDAARERGFVWILIFLARELDAQSSYEQLNAYWDSFDDLTSDKYMKPIVIPIHQNNLYDAIKNVIAHFQNEFEEYSKHQKNLKTLKKRLEENGRCIINAEPANHEKRFAKAASELERILGSDSAGVDRDMLCEAMQKKDYCLCKQFPQPVRGYLNQWIDLQKNYQNISDCHEKCKKYEQALNQRNKLYEEIKTEEEAWKKASRKLNRAMKRYVDAVRKNHMKNERHENTMRPILLVTANDNETNAFLEEPEFKYERIRGLKKADSNFYYKGDYYGYQVVHFQTPNQGSVQSGSAGFSVQAAIEEFKPCAVIMFGIAFGFDDGEYKIGDVLVSQRIIDYESGKVSEDPFRSDSDIPGAGPELLSICKELAREWNHQASEGKARVRIGDIASGDKVINCKNFRDALPTGNHKIIGGEMEGRGLYSACRRNGISEWIVIKAICDWGYEKENNKEKNQIIAAKSAVAFIREMFYKNMLQKIIEET